MGGVVRAVTGLIGGLTGMATPKKPDLPPEPETPKASNTDTSAAMDAAAQAAAASVARGRAATLLTGGAGIEKNPDDKKTSKTLLGK